MTVETMMCGLTMRGWKRVLSGIFEVREPQRTKRKLQWDVSGRSMSGL